jgi:hypothetical protein
MEQVKAVLNGHRSSVYQMIKQVVKEKDPMDPYFRNLIQSTRRFTAILLTVLFFGLIYEICLNLFKIKNIVQYREIFFIWFLTLITYSFYCFALWISDLMFAIITAREEFKKKQKDKK